ncbi:MAG: hypothetical protein L0Z55_05315 [Planctomycetes bacterium]|nr:hypothetical protein [Planctomycetota bacterium]
MKVLGMRSTILFLALLAANPLWATFDVEIDIAIDNQTAGAASGFIVEFVATATDEIPSTIAVEFDKGALDLAGIVAGDVIGTMEFPITSALVTGSIEGDFEVTATTATSVEGDVAITSIDPILVTLLGVDVGDALLTFTFTDYGTDTGTTLEISDSAGLPATSPLPVDATITIDLDPIYVHTPAAGDLTVTATITSGLFSEVTASETFEIAAGTEPQFLRGDASANGLVNALIDALFLLNYQFSAGPAPPCFASADVDGDGAVNALLDALYILAYQFSSGPAPPAPGPTVCGPDPNALECLAPGPC